MDSQESPMFLAARDCDVERMKHLAEGGVSLDSVDCEGFTLLQRAALWGRFEVAEYLVLNNCDINRKADDGRTAVLMAAGVEYRRRKNRIVELLVKSGADLDGRTGPNEWTVLHYASFHGWTDVVQIIVENGAVDVNAKSSTMQTSLMLALQNGYENISELLIGAGAEFRSCDNEKMNVLHYACSTGHYSKEGLAKIVKCIVDRGETDLSAKSIHKWTPLLYAVHTQKEDIAEILIQAGADANADPDPLTGLSVLHYAFWKGWRKLFRVIVEKGGCDPNPTSGPAPLQLACQYRNVDIIKLLIASGCDVNFENGECEKALYYCLNRGDFESIRLLVTHGAYFGTEELQILSRYHNQELRELLLEDAQLCTQSLINKFNNCSLPAVYNVPVFYGALPPMKTVAINSDESTAAQEIANFVDSQIKTKRISNVFERRPIVLKFICVEWLIQYKATLRRTASSCIGYQAKKQRLN